MSSEGRYDYTYAQFLEDDSLSLELFGDSNIISTTATSFEDVLEHCSNVLLPNEQSFFHDGADSTSDNRQLEMLPDSIVRFNLPAFSISQSFDTGFSNQMDHTTVFAGALQSDFGIGDFISQETQSPGVEDLIKIQEEEPQAWCPTPWNIHSADSNDLLTPRNYDVAESLRDDDLESGPIDVSFFLDQR